MCPTGEDQTPIMVIYSFMEIQCQTINFDVFIDLSSYVYTRKVSGHIMKLFCLAHLSGLS